MINYSAIIFLGLMSFQGINACTNPTLKTKIEAVEVRDKSALMGETFYRVFYSGDLVMYQSQYRFDTYENQLQYDSLSNQITSNKSQLSSQWKDQFFIFHKDSSYGFNYDAYRSRENNLRLKVDSVVNFIKGTNRLDSFLTVKPDSTFWNANKTELKEVFLFPAAKYYPGYRLILHYSRSMNHLKESFNRTVDSVKKMKLYKTEVVFNEVYDEKNKKLWPSETYFTEMRTFSVQNPDTIMGYFNRYKNSIVSGK